MKLYNVLHTWVVGQHSNARQATLENLKAALASPLVQHPQLAGELEDKLKTSLDLSQPTGSNKFLFQSEVRKLLVENYLQSPEVPCSSWPPVVSKSFVDLALIETSGQPLKSDYSIQGDADDVLAKNTEVEYKKMFGYYERKKKFLILGRPGSGKTTLANKIVRDWSADKALQGAELVFLVSLRMLSSKNDKKLSDIILQTLFFDKNDLKKVSKSIEQAQGDRVCFVFDGFDEYCPQDKKVSVIYALLNKLYLVNAMIIVTSNPATASANSEIFNESFKKIEVFGFSKTKITEYISKFPFSSSSSDHSEQLQQFLESRPGVLDLCYLPVHCAIICFIYDIKPDHLPDTQTEIYALFTRSIIIRRLTSRDKFRQLHSLEDLEGKEAKDFKKLCNLAFDMTVKSKQVITKGPANSDEAQSLGLTTTDITAGLCGYENSYSFLHLTLQEFLAAYHLSKLDDNQQLSVIEKFGRCHYLLTMWKFYFGLVHFEKGSSRAIKLLHQISQIRSSRTGLMKIQCSFEAKQASICQLVSSRVLIIRECTLSNYDMFTLACTMSMAASQEYQATTPTTHLYFQYSGPGYGKLVTLFQHLDSRALRYLEHLEFSHDHINNMDIKALADKLKLNGNSRQKEIQGLTNLKLLYLQDTDIRDEGVATLAAGLNGNQVLEQLNLSINPISCVGVGALMESDCHLRVLYLAKIGMDDDGAGAVARGLRRNPTLEHINLSYNQISVDGVAALAFALRGNASRFASKASLSTPPSSDLLDIEDCNREKIPRLDQNEPVAVLRFVTHSSDQVLKCQSPFYRASIILTENTKINEESIVPVLQGTNMS